MYIFSKKIINCIFDKFKKLFIDIDKMPYPIIVLFYFIFSISFNHGMFHSSKSILLYDKIDKFGFNLLGYFNVVDLSIFITNTKIFSQILAIFFGILTFFLKAKQILLLSAIFINIKSISCFFIKNNKYFYFCEELFDILSLSFLSIAVYRIIFFYIKQVFKDKKDDISVSSYINWYILHNLAYFLGKIFSGYFRIYFGAFYLFSFIFFISIFSLILIIFKLKINCDNIKNNFENDKESMINIFISPITKKPTKNLLSLILVLILFVHLVVSFSYEKLIFKNKIIDYGIYILFLPIIFFYSKNEIILIIFYGDKIKKIKSLLLLLIALISMKIMHVSIDLLDIPIIKMVNDFGEKKIFGIKIPSEIISSLNPIIVIFFGGFISKFFLKLRLKYSFYKYLYTLVIGFGIYLISSLFILFMHFELLKFNKFNYLFPVLYTIFITIGEIICSPIYDLLISSSLPSKYVGITTTLNRLTNVIGNRLLTIIPYKASMNHNIYPVFLLFFIIVFCAFIFTLIFSSYLNQRITEISILSNNVLVKKEKINKNKNKNINNNKGSNKNKFNKK